jgi:PAS domain S-box-containing protein
MIDEEMMIQNILSAKENGEALLAEILKSRRQWQATLDAITDYIFVTDERGEIKRANMSFSTWFQKHPRDIIGVSLDRLFRPEGVLLKGVLERAVVSKSPVLDEVTVEGATFMISIFPSTYDEDDVYVCIMKDVSELKMLRDKVYHSYKLASIGQLVSGVAHEINNPLTGILGFVELLGMKGKDLGIKKELEKIHQAAERCKKIVESLLCFSRQQVPHRSLDHINEVLDRALELRAYWFKAKDLEVVKDYGEIPLAYMDVQQIQQSIVNILINAEQAIESSGRRGRISFTTRYDTEEKRIVIAISDNGTGIPEKYIGKIFDPFFTTKPVDQGTGLGLSIAYGVFAEHGGGLKVKSREGEGTDFIIELPVNHSGQGSGAVVMASGPAQ